MRVGLSRKRSSSQEEVPLAAWPWEVSSLNHRHLEWRAFNRHRSAALSIGLTSDVFNPGSGPGQATATQPRLHGAMLFGPML